jgi:alpha-D-ribose 1-methylphosphonate 5-triphosphate synthase subunit PhnI
MRGYGDVHPTIGDLRVGWVPLRIRHPHSGNPVLIGRVLVTEAEVLARFEAAGKNGSAPTFTVGYGLCFGHNELKAICMAVLDRAMNEPEARAPAEDEEFVLAHVDPVEASGFALHYKLPHYVTFQSEIDRVRAVRRQAARREGGHDAGL